MKFHRFNRSDKACLRQGRIDFHGFHGDVCLQSRCRLEMGDRIRNRIDAPAHDMSLNSSSPLTSSRKSEPPAWAFLRREGQDEAAFSRQPAPLAMVSARSDEFDGSKTRTCVSCELVSTHFFAGSTTAYFGDSNQDRRHREPVGAPIVHRDWPEPPPPKFGNTPGKSWRD